MHFNEPDNMAKLPELEPLSAAEEMAALKAELLALKASKATNSVNVSSGAMAGLPRLSGHVNIDSGTYNVHGVAVSLESGKYYIGDASRAWPPLGICEGCKAPREYNVLAQCERGTDGLVFVSGGGHKVGCSYGDYISAYPAGVPIGGKIRSAPLTFQPYTPDA